MKKATRQKKFRVVRGTKKMQVCFKLILTEFYFLMTWQLKSKRNIKIQLSHLGEINSTTIINKEEEKTTKEWITWETLCQFQPTVLKQADETKCSYVLIVKKQ